MLKKMASILTIATLFTGCSTSATKLISISPGMTKAQVINILGNPESVSGKGGAELFTYTLSNGWDSYAWKGEYNRSLS